MSELEHFAGAIAPVVQRLRDAVDRGVRAQNEQFLDEWELTDAALEILTLLRNTMPDRLAPWHNVAAALVYASPSLVMRGVDDLVLRRMLVTSGDGTHLAPKGREAIESLHTIRSKVIDELWGEHEALCTTLLPLLRSVVDSASATGGEAFALQVPPYERAGSSPQVSVAELLTPLHFHRFDAHVAAWRAAGLRPSEARELTSGALWRALRDETDVRDAAAYAELKARHRVKLLAGLGALPG